MSVLLRVLLVTALLFALAQAGTGGSKLKGTEKTLKEQEARLKCASAVVETERLTSEDDREVSLPEEPDLQGVITDIKMLPYSGEACLKIADVECGLVFHRGDYNSNIPKIKCEPKEYYEKTSETLAVLWPDEADPVEIDRVEGRESSPPAICHSLRSFDYFVTMYMGGYHSVDKKICELWEDVENTFERYLPGQLENPIELIERDLTKSETREDMKRCKDAIVEVAELLDEYEIPVRVLECLSRSGLLQSIVNEGMDTERHRSGTWSDVADSFYRAEHRVTWLLGAGKREERKREDVLEAGGFLSPHSEHDYEVGDPFDFGPPSGSDADEAGGADHDIDEEGGYVSSIDPFDPVDGYMWK